MKRLLQFGAGKIGRSFIAQLFSRAGYEIVFIDIDPCVVRLLNEAEAYNVYIKGTDSESTYRVDNVQAIEFGNTREVIQQIVDSDIISISVGKQSLLDIAGILARGVKERYQFKPEKPVDIILAENVRDAASLLSNAMGKRLKKLPLTSYVGFVETSIGKMVPLMTSSQLEKDPLSIFAEPYNELIVDRLAFRGPIPDVPELRPKERMKAWVDRKIFIHNLGHAVLAYQAFYGFPNINYTWEALSIVELRNITRLTMLQAARILQKMYPEEFSLDYLEQHIDDLLYRFSNKALGDTIFRVGMDIERKLGRHDRLMLPVTRGLEEELPVDLILEAWVKGCYFARPDEEGNIFRKDLKFNQKFKQDPGRILREHCKFTPLENPELFRQLALVQSKLKEQ